MKPIASLPIILSDMSEKVNGIFRRSDLANLFSTSNGDTLSKRIKFLMEGGYLKRAIQGIYYTPDAKIMDLAQRIFQDGYFSSTTALSLHTMIGTRPMRNVTIITTRPRSKVFHFDIGTVKMKRVHCDYFFGFDQRGQHKVATPEKAFIDACYFHMKNESLPFDLASEVRVNHMDIDMLRNMIDRYENKRFVQFVLNMIEENGR